MTEYILASVAAITILCVWLVASGVSTIYTIESYIKRNKDNGDV